MSFTSFDGCLLKLPKLCMKIGQWVLVRSMALNCIPSNSKTSTCKLRKDKEELMQGGGSNSALKWKEKLLILWVVSGFIWVLYSVSSNWDWSEVSEISNYWSDKAQSLNQFRSFMQSNQNTSPSTELSECKEEYTGSLTVCWLKIFWWVIVGMLLSWTISYFRERWCAKRERKQVHQIQALAQPQPQPLQYSENAAHSRVFGSFWLFWSMNSNINLLRTEMLSNMCDERARMLQDQFNVSMNHVHALAILVSTFHHGKQPSAIDQKTFAQYTERTAFERPLTSGVAYAVKVLHTDREKFEKHHGWTIKKMDKGDPSSPQDYITEKLDPAPIQDEYAPVTLSQKLPREHLASEGIWKGVLTSPFPLLKSNHLGVVLTFAVYKTDLPADATPDQRIEATLGYLGASYDVPSLVEKLLHQLASKQKIVVNVYDTTNRSTPINMYGPSETDVGHLHLSKLDFGDPSRRHEMHCSTSPWQAIMASAGVFVITLLVGHIFNAAINRISKVEDDYCEMMTLKIRAEAADVAKSQFLATVSHEIRTPMNGVLGMLQMLMDTKLDADQQDFAQTAYASGSDLISLINEVLDQAKIESGRLELEEVDFDLRIVLDNVLSLFTEKSRDKGLEVTSNSLYFSFSSAQSNHGDPGRFRQIVTNLVGNSIKFTEKGHIFITVHLVEEVNNLIEVGDEVLKQQLELLKEWVDPSYSTLSGFPVVDRWKSWENFKKLSNVIGITEETDMVRLLITVEDTGAGIPLDAQNRIFMPFMQADSSTSRIHGGTGIGLSISKCLVELMGGEIGFCSKPECGSAFTFTLILKRGQIQSNLETNQNEIETFLKFQGLKGLVVDGKSIRAQLTRYQLQRLGICVELTADLESACSYASEASQSSANFQFDVVFIEEDGLENGTAIVTLDLLKELRENGRHKPLGKCPKIFLLARSRSAKLDELKSNGYVDEIITKPLRLSTLSKLILGTGTNKYFSKAKSSNLKSLLSGRKILVVDDNKVNCRVAAGALSKYGAEVTCVESGKDAVKMLQPPHAFGACFMDLQMPEMDGFEATKQIRSYESKSNEQFKRRNGQSWHTPILAMTADVFQATHEKCMEWGMDGYVAKPF
ncbi:hypothetical protein MKW92_023539 [Papaver armeniacum]|nr:hypothetical protein MKW92_023539 [Papaver armeniacum]